MTVGQKSRTCESYSYSDILDLPLFKDKRSAPDASKAKRAAQIRDVDKSKR